MDESESSGQRCVGERLLFHFFFFLLYRMVHEDVIQILLQRSDRIDGHKIG